MTTPKVQSNLGEKVKNTAIFLSPRLGLRTENTDKLKVSNWDSNSQMMSRSASIGFALAPLIPIPFFAINLTVGISATAFMSVLGYFVIKKLFHHIRVKESTLRTEAELQSKLEIERVKLVNSEKLSALGGMAGGIAHEINNPLAIILGNSQSLRLKLTRNEMSIEDITKVLEKIEATAKRISKVVNNLRLFASEGIKDEFIDTSVQMLIEDMKGFWLQRLQDHQIALHIQEFDPQLAVQCRPVQIVLVILNLIGNSFHAVKPLPEKWIKIDVRDKGHMVEIHFIDSGRGISPEIQSQIFDPFFTTREVGEGSGLGLSVSAGIAKVHHGSLIYDSSNSNTSFVLSLPKARPVQRSSESAA
jgi:C4-dicarboxylate-specific signal transduction histidine kinase